MQKKAKRIYQFLLGFIALGLLAIAINAFYTGEFNLVVKGKYSSHYTQSSYFYKSAYLLASCCVLLSIGMLIKLMIENPKNRNYLLLKRIQRILMWVGVLGLILTIIVSR